MSKFKVGDKVKRNSGCAFSNGKKVCTIGSLEGPTPQSVWLMETGTSIRESKLILAENNKQHKHAALIHAWADGAKIQVASYVTDTWSDVLQSPAWDHKKTYRIKPEKSAAGLEKESIIKEMEALKVRLDKLEVN